MLVLPGNTLGFTFHIPLSLFPQPLVVLDVLVLPLYDVTVRWDYRIYRNCPPLLLVRYPDVWLVSQQLQSQQSHRILVLLLSTTFSSMYVVVYALGLGEV